MISFEKFNWLCKKYRLKAGDIAKGAGVTMPVVSKIRSNDGEKMYLSSIAKVANYLDKEILGEDITIDSLMSYIDDEEGYQMCAVTYLGETKNFLKVSGRDGLLLRIPKNKVDVVGNKTVGDNIFLDMPDSLAVKFGIGG